MAFASDFHMPGAYGFTDAPAQPNGQPLSHTMVRPPMSPSASSSVYNIAKSTGSLYSDMSMVTTPGAIGTKRKRARADTRMGNSPMADWMNMDGPADAREDGERIRYTLAGQIETPGAAPHNTGANMMEDSHYSDVNYRRELGPTRGLGEMESPSGHLSNLQVGAQPGIPAQSRGWSIFSLHSTIGGVVGKVWEFCKTGSFRGFHAGGGKGYDMSNAPTPAVDEQSARPWPNEHDLPTPFTDSGRRSGGSDLLDELPKADFTYFPDYTELESAEITPRPAAKRRQVSHTKETNDDLVRTWVMVEDQPVSPVLPSARVPRKPGLPRRKTTTAASSFTRPISEASAAAAARPSPRPAPRYSIPTASSSRRINIPVPRLSTGSTASTNSNTSDDHNRHTPLRRSLPSASASFTTPHTPASAASFRAASPAPLSTPSRIPLPHSSAAGSGPNPFARPPSAAKPAHTPAHAPASSRIPALPLSRRASLSPLNPFAHSSAAGASSQSRIPSRPSSRASLSHLPTTPVPSRNSGHAPRRSNASAASVSSPVSTRRGGGSRRSGGISPLGEVDGPRLTAEAKQLALSKMAAEREADVKMEAFNKRLVDMIRQGKEALGTRVEVQGDMEMEGVETPGWADDE